MEDGQCNPRYLTTRSSGANPLDLRDDQVTAASLLRLLNLIAERMISEPKHIDEMYSKLPQSARDEIDRKDGRTSN
jgi:hypothetical protein